MTTLAWPWVLLVLPLPLGLRWLLPRASRPLDGRALRLPTEQAPPLLASVVRRPPHAARLVALLIWLLLVTAAVRPQWLGDPVALPVAGRDLMLVLDLSGSMQQTDYSLNGQPASRLDVVKSAAGRFIARREQDRLGLILFGTRPYVQTPLTYDRDSVAQMLREAVVGLAGVDTAIGDAIGLAVKRLREQPQGNRVVVLLTDGANSAGALLPRQAARLAAEAGVRIYAIGLGGAVGAEDAGGYRVERVGEDLDARTLRAVAEITGGRYFTVTNDAELNRVYAALERLEPSVRDLRTYRPATELYPLPAAAALAISLLWVLMVLLRETPWRRRPASSDPA